MAFHIFSNFSVMSPGIGVHKSAVGAQKKKKKKKKKRKKKKDNSGVSGQFFFFLDCWLLSFANLQLNHNFAESYFLIIQILNMTDECEMLIRILPK